MNAVIGAVSGALGDISPTGQLESIRLDGDTVKVMVNNGDRQLPLSITYMEPSSYPRSGCLILCDEDRFSCKLSAASERFQDSAALSAVLAKVSLSQPQLCKHAVCSKLHMLCGKANLMSTLNLPFPRHCFQLLHGYCTPQQLRYCSSHCQYCIGLVAFQHRRS